MMALGATDVTLRYVFNAPLSWGIPVIGMTPSAWRLADFGTHAWCEPQRNRDLSQFRETVASERARGGLYSKMPAVPPTFCITIWNEGMTINSYQEYMTGR